MALNAKNIKSDSTFTRPDPREPGAYPARLVQILSLGLQPQQPYKGEEKPPRPELYLTYELLDEFMLDAEGNEDESKPIWISERIPMHSLDSDLAKSTKRYTALDPEFDHDGDWAELAGAPCTVTIANYEIKNGKNKGQLRDKVASISTMRTKEASKARPLVNEPKVFDIDDPNMEIFGSLPEWIQKVMTEENLEYGGSALEKAFEKAGGISKFLSSNKNESDDSKDSDDNESEDESDEDEDW